MNENLKKIKTYIGFSIKARKIVFGTDDILRLKKLELIVVSSSLAESSLKKLKNYADSRKVEIKIFDDAFFVEAVNSESIKAAAILDKNLADAIKLN